MPHIKSRKHSAPRYSSSLQRVAGVTVSAAAVLGAAPALAQPATQPNLPTVEVQAAPDFKADASASQKFTAPLVDTPKSVTVIPNEVIRQTNATTLTEALRNTPGITFGAGEGGNPVGDRPFLRGYDSQSSTFVDGLRDIAPATRETFNIESVEVIKGPDSAYGGRGGAGGTINLYTKAPRRDDFFTGSIGLGSDSYRRATVDLNRSFGESGAFRLNAMDFSADVAGRDGPSNKRWGLAPSVSWGLGTPTRVTLSLFAMKTDDMPDGGVPYQLPSTFPSFGEVKLRPTYGGNRENFYGVYGRDFRRDTSYAGTLLVEHDFSPELKLRNITRATHSTMNYIWTQPDDSQGNVARGLVWRRFNGSVRDIKTVANASELSGRFDTGSLGHRFAVGLELSREEADNDSYTQNFAAYTANQKCPRGAGVASSFVCTGLFAPTPNDPWLGSFTQNGNPTSYRTRTASLYAFDTIEFTPQWLLNVGLRWDSYKTDQWNPIAMNNGLASRLKFSNDDKLLNYQLGLVYKPAANGSVYVSVGTSSTPGGGSTGQGLESQGLSATVNGVANTALDLKPEKNRSIEIGTKWDLLDKQLSLTGAIFRIDTTNARVSNPDGTVTMAGDKQVQGLELGFSGNISRQWQVFGGYTLMNSKGKNLGLTNVGTAAAPRYVANAATGQPFPNTPRHSFSLWTSYKPTSDWTLGIGAYAQSKVYSGYAYAAGTNGNTLIQRGAPGYTRLDAMVGYRVNRNFDLQLNVQNLTDKVYYSTVYSTHYANMAPGRSIVLTGNLSF